jgi:hypothetical protein
LRRNYDLVEESKYIARKNVSQLFLGEELDKCLFCDLA